MSHSIDRIIVKARAADARRILRTGVLLLAMLAAAVGARRPLRTDQYGARWAATRGTTPILAGNCPA